MCARRFLIAIFFLTLIACAGAFAVYQYGGEVLKAQTIPTVEFTAPPPESGPDYADAANWLNLPGSDVPGPAEWRPSGFVQQPGLADSQTAATFYIHPTTYLERNRWNGLLDHQESQDRAALFVRSQSSAFNGVADVFAPRYRQAAFGAFLDDSADARAALDLAYRDVARAFDQFLTRIEPGRPIILAGHSQGALHLARLMRDKVAGKPVAKRIVASYIIGWPLSVKADVPGMGLPACRTAEQATCILSWQSFGEPANTTLVTDVYDGSVAPNGMERQRRDMLCTNPVNGTLNGAAPSAANAGTLVPTDAALTDATLAAGQVGARCDNGFLIIDGEVPNLGPYVLPGNNYHVYDYALFWGSIREDAARRLTSWRR